jgi:hypothetical protein
MLKNVSQDSHIRNIGGLIVILTALVIGADFQVDQILPPAAIIISGILYNSIEKEHKLPAGSKNAIVGFGFIVAGISAYISVFNIVGSALSLVGFWFIFDGFVTSRYSSESVPDRPSMNSRKGVDEAMLQIYTTNMVYRMLSNAREPQPASKIGEDLDLTESRVNRTLSLLENRDRIKNVEGGYIAIPSRWGLMGPFVRFLIWVPKRVLRPFIQLLGSGR